MYLCEPECTLLLEWGLEFWDRWLCFLCVARETQAFPRGRSLCSSSWLKDWNSILFHQCEIQDPGGELLQILGSTKLHKAVPLADGIDFLHAHRLDGKVSSHSHKWMVWYMSVDFPEAEERTKPGFWNVECRLCASCSEWVPMLDQIPLVCYRCSGDAQNVPLRVVLTNVSFLTDSWVRITN